MKSIHRKLFLLFTTYFVVSIFVTFFPAPQFPTVTYLF